MRLFLNAGTFSSGCKCYFLRKNSKLDFKWKVSKESWLMKRSLTQSDCLPRWINKQIPSGAIAGLGVPNTALFRLFLRLVQNCRQCLDSLHRVQNKKLNRQLPERKRVATYSLQTDWTRLTHLQGTAEELSFAKIRWLFFQRMSAFVSDTLFPKGMFALCIIIRLGHVESIRGQQSIMQMNTHSGTVLVDSPHVVVHCLHVALVMCCQSTCTPLLHDQSF